jgi:hypothetical protein
MVLARVFDRSYAQYELRTYECKVCRVAYTVGEIIDPDIGGADQIDGQ